MSRPFSNLESIVKSSIMYGKFGGLLVRHNDAAGVGAAERDAIGADNANETRGEVTKPRSATPVRPSMRSAFSAIGPFSGKIGFRKGL